MDGVLPFLLRTPVRRGRDVPRRFLLVALSLSLSSSDVFLLGWAFGLIIRNGPGHLDPLAPHPYFGNGIATIRFSQIFFSPYFDNAIATNFFFSSLFRQWHCHN